MSTQKEKTIGFFIFPNMLQMDFTGPFAVFSAGPAVKTGLIWHEKDQIRSSDGLIFQPDTLSEDCPELDVFCIPGGGGVTALMEDRKSLDFIRKQSERSRVVASVCTGSLVLGAAGLLAGRKATTHWMSLDLLPIFDAIPVRQRYVQDGKFITASGVSAGIDMALMLAGHLWGQDIAQAIQLSMEYNPQPPFTSGTPETAPAEVVAKAISKTAERQNARKEAAVRAAKLLAHS